MIVAMMSSSLAIFFPVLAMIPPRKAPCDYRNGNHPIFSGSHLYPAEHKKAEWKSKYFPFSPFDPNSPASLPIKFHFGWQPNVQEQKRLVLLKLLALISHRQISPECL
nr:hypothetical protein [Bacilli bacterium]